MLQVTSMSSALFRWLQYFAFLGLVLGLAEPFGRYLVRVFERRWTPFDRVLVPIERVLHRLSGIRPDDEMSWKKYAASFALFGAVNILIVYLVLRFQLHLPGARARSPPIHWSSLAWYWQLQ
jgi:K+-transporting ATPase ATPase A chain